MQGNDTFLKSPPTVTEKSKGDGIHLFNTFSLLLSGRQTYNAIIRHVICNYISNPVKYPSIKSYLPTRYKNGREYVMASNMRQFNMWGTEVEIMSFAQSSDMMCMFTLNRSNGQGTLTPLYLIVI